MAHARLGSMLLACAAVACDAGGTIAAVADGGASDAGGHDVAFVPQTNVDGGDAQADTSPSDAGADGDATLTQLGQPTFNPPTGAALVVGSSIIIDPPAGFPSGGELRYTLDGSAPTHQSTLYVGPVQMTAVFDSGCGGTVPVIVTAVASAPGYLDSLPAAATYGIVSIGSGDIAPVTFDIPAGSMHNDFLLGLTGPGPAGNICYTTDGTVPTCSAAAACTGTSVTYSAANRVAVDGAITNQLTGAVTVSAIACYNPLNPTCGFAQTNPVSQTYVLAAADPTMANPPPGTATSGVTPTLSTTTVSSVATTDPVSIHMTTDGSTPTCTSGTALPGSSTVGPLTATTTVKAIACKTGYLASNVVPFVYTIP